MDNNVTDSSIRTSSKVTSLIYLAVSFLGLIGNALIIFAIVTKRCLKSNYYCLVLHLAVCDLVLLLCFTIRYAIFPWIKAQKASLLHSRCKILTPLTNYVYNLEVYIMVAIGALRHRAIVHPFRQPLTRTQIKGIVILGHVIAFLVQTPYAFSFKSSNRSIECTITWVKQYPSVFKLYECILIVVTYAIPMIISVFLYMKISYALLLHHRLMVSTSGDEKTVAARLVNAKQIRNTKAAIVGAIVVTLFCVGNLPYNITRQMNSYGTSINPTHSFWIKLWWIVCTCTVNPVIYGFADPTLLLAFKRTVKGFVK